MWIPRNPPRPRPLPWKLRWPRAELRVVSYSVALVAAHGLLCWWEIPLLFTKCNASSAVHHLRIDQSFTFATFTAMRVTGVVVGATVAALPIRLFTIAVFLRKLLLHLFRTVACHPGLCLPSGGAPAGPQNDFLSSQSRSTPMTWVSVPGTAIQRLDPVIVKASHPSRSPSRLEVAELGWHAGQYYVPSRLAFSVGLGPDSLRSGSQAWSFSEIRLVESTFSSSSSS